MRSHSVSRRDFLKLLRTAVLAACGLLGLGGLIRFLEAQTEPAPRTDFDLGLVSDFTTGSRMLRPEIPALISRTDAGFSILSLVCTHLGCTVENKPEGFICPCHGSRFDLNGKVTRGPAFQPLRFLRYEITQDGHLHVYTN
jgi:cytochrome b6-f complex iron-sulfur subunit